MQRIGRIIAVAAAALAGAAFLPSVASAHEHRAVDNGKYNLVVGWVDEPAVSGYLNGLDFRVAQAPAGAASPAAGADEDQPEGAPVEGVESTLQAEIIFVDQKMTLTLEPAETPGSYTAAVIPTQAGDYSFHIFGTINGDQIDETFTSGPNTFDTVTDAATLQFPKASAQRNGVLAGTIGGGNGADILGGLAVGLALGAAGLRLVGRRGTVLRRPAFGAAGVHAGAGD
ncbi:MAG TPA: hypothetical protein VGF55_02760 [Gemmataceae bacterium]